MRVLPALFLLPLLVTLPGCTTLGQTFRPTVISASEAGITYRISPDRLDEATTAAATYCASRNTVAHLDRVTPNGDGKSSAIFVCS